MKKFFSAQNLGNLHQLIIIVVSMKKGFLSKNHASKHASKRPHVKGVIVFLQIDQKLRSFKIARCHADVVLSSRVVKFSETPINESELTLFMINHDIVRLDIPVHDSVGVTIIQCLEQFENVVADVIVREGWV